MNYAICYVSIGEEAINLLKYSYFSLRKSGFSGDVYVFTDGDFSLDLDDRAIIRMLDKKYLNMDINYSGPLSICDVRRLDDKNKRNILFGDKFAICHAKTLILQLVPLDKYDYVVYLDSDILVQGPIERFNKYLKNNRGAIITSANKIKKLGAPIAEILNGHFRKMTVSSNLSLFELLRNWFTKPVCADIVCIPNTPVGRGFLEGWQKECQRGIDSDQAALQAVLLRRFKKMHKLAPFEIFGFGPSHHEYLKNKELKKVESVFVHFNGAIRDSSAFLGYSRSYIENT